MGRGSKRSVYTETGNGSSVIVRCGEGSGLWVMDYVFIDLHLPCYICVSHYTPPLEITQFSDLKTMDRVDLENMILDTILQRHRNIGS